MFILDLY